MGKKFKKVAVLMGGPSAEAEVSLRSGAAISKALRMAGYSVDEVNPKDGVLKFAADVEAVFIALHGAFGEDGVVQQKLCAMNMPYIGSGAEASRKSLDKLASKRVFAEAKIPTAAYEVLTAPGPHKLPLPLVVKPASEGSSIGLHCVRHEGDWDAAARDALAHGNPVLVEKYIPGRELTVGILGEDALPVVEICAPDGWYDYGAKYTKGRTEYHVPAALTAEQTARCQELGRHVFRALGCRDLGRVDLRLTPDNELFVLEMNTIPGFTETSLLPKAAAAAGINFVELCDRIMQRASVH
ncbi:MAG: D-alanine--D-alanine ligase [Kiritimatiellaeota bacterium]|nr:D-alanine--D-alanine ligase [Kiritimatiellota bacterium]